MGKIITTIIDRFDGGLTEDKRSGWISNGNIFTTNKFSITKHFDTYTYPKKLVPYHKTEAVETKTFDIVKFLQVKNSGGTERLYGYGVATGTTKAAVYFLSADVWTGLVNNESSTAGRNEMVFFFYKDFIYMWRSNNLMRFDTTGSAVWNDSYQAISFTTLASPVHHYADDIAYFFTDNKVHTLNDSTWTSNVLTLPSNLKIMDAVPYGDYLAIGCAPIGTNGVSVVYLWDRDSSLATLSERIDFGEGELTHLANLNNRLTAIMDYYLDDGNGLRKGKILIKQRSGAFATTLMELVTDSILAAGTIFQGNKVISGNKLYYAGRLNLNGDTRLGIWSVDEFGRATLDTIEEEASSYEGIYLLGNTWWIAHSNDGSTNRTDDNLVFSTSLSSTYETLIFTKGDSSIRAKLIGATVTTEPLPAAGQIVLKYRINEETDWTTIFTEATDNSISHSATNIESSGANLREFKELQLQILSTGGAVVTGLKFKVEITGKDIYE